MDIVISHMLRSPKFLMVEVVAVSFLISLVLVTILNSMEVRHHPERFRIACLGMFVGIAVATGLSALHNHIPLWQFGLSVYAGLVAGLIAFLVAPSKAQIDKALRRISGHEPLEDYGEPERGDYTYRLPAAAPSDATSTRRKTTVPEAQTAIVPRKISTTFNQQRLIAQILELSEQAEREGVALDRIIDLLEDNRFRKGERRRVG